MDLKVTGTDMVTKADVERSGDALMSSYKMFATPCYMLIRATYLYDLSTIIINL